jgi:predicted ribosomally synthesized peptide with SipW-like signal peptide
MRGRTTIALGAVLAGTLLTGVGTTSAAFSDTAMVQVGTVGAGELSLTVTTAEQVPVQLGGGKADFTVTRTGVGAAVLRLSVVDGAASDACATLPAAKVTVSVPGDPNPVRTTLCELTAGSEDVVRFTGRLTSVTLTVKVIVPAEQSAAGAWDGLLHFELGQRGGGFSDVQDVAARVVVPGGG